MAILKPGLAFASAAALAIHVVWQNRRKRRARPSVIHPGGPEEARKIAHSYLEGSDTQFWDLFRMDKVTFKDLVLWLQHNTGLRSSRYQTAEQKVMVVLWILGHAESQRNAAHMFQISQSTISGIMDSMLPRLVSLHKAFVRLPPDNWLDLELELNPKTNAFNGCIGAIDGTHIAAHIKRRHQLRWRNRKGFVSQNVFAAVKSDFSFSYVLAGAEGSINDASLCAQAFGRSFKVPEDRYYVVDAGFGIRNGIVVPFPGVRYHLQDWRDAGNPPETRKELYNLRHARIRVVAEQAFGILKRKWKIVRIAPIEYSIEKQIQIVYAVTGLHNFLLSRRKKDRISAEERRILSLARARARRMVRRRHPDFIRHSVAHVLWEQYSQYCQRR